MSASYKGASATIANPSRRTEKKTRSGVIEVTLELDGKYSDLVAIRDANPAGTALSGYSPVPYITERAIRRDGKGDMSTLTIEATSAVESTDFSGGDGATSEDTLEVDWARIEQDIRYHPVWDSGTYTVTTAERKIIERKLQNSANTEELGDGAAALYDRLVKGQTHYPFYVPVVRKSTASSTRPLTGGVGSIDTATAISAGGPPQSANGRSYTYIKTADRRIKQGGRWTRYQEWTGFEKVDTLTITAA
jgi:hypothetical protein